MPGKKRALVYSESAAVGIVGDAFHQKHFMWSVVGSDTDCFSTEHKPSGTKVQFQKILPTSRTRSSIFLLRDFNCFLVLAEESTLEGSMRELGDIRKANRAPVMVIVYSKPDGQETELPGQEAGGSKATAGGVEAPRKLRKAEIKRARKAPMGSITSLGELRNKAAVNDIRLIETRSLDSSPLLPEILSFAAGAAKRPDEGEYDVAGEEIEKARCAVM